MARKPESNMRSKVLAALRSLDAQAVENPINPGTPDVNYVEGWIECKQLPNWPKTAEFEPVKIKHFTPQQRVWLKMRAKRKGVVYFLLKVKNEWLLFNGIDAAEHVGTMTRPQLRELAVKCWDNGLKDKELLSWLKKT